MALPATRVLPSHLGASHATSLIRFFSFTKKGGIGFWKDYEQRAPNAMGGLTTVGRGMAEPKRPVDVDEDDDEVRGRLIGHGMGRACRDT